MTSPVPDLSATNIFVVSAEETVTAVKYEDDVDNSQDLSKPRVSISRQGEETVIIVTEKTRNCTKFFIAVVVLFCTSGAGVADQQLSQLVNSPTFHAPFFFLWFAGLIRSFTYLVYLPFRVLFEYVAESGRLEKTNQTLRRPISKVTSDLIHDGTRAFGKDGITCRSFSLNILPFALSWIATNGLFYWAVTFAPVSECVTIGSSFIVITYIVSWMFLKEKFLVIKALGIIICLSGVGLTAYASGSTFGDSEGSVIGALLTTGSAISLALTTVAFKRCYGCPNVNQIAMYLSLTSLTNAIVSWPIFVGLRLANEEIWNFDTNPWDLMSISTVVSSVGSLLYYIGTSLINPVFISLTRPLQIVINYGIDLGRGAVTFNALNAIGTGLVVIGFFILIIPNNIVSLELRAFTIRLRPGRNFELHQTGLDNRGMSEDVEMIVFERTKVL